jgi:DNA-binding transcriptional LysR family regulator
VPDARTIVELHDRAVARLQSSDLTGWAKIGSNEEVDATRMASLLGRFKRAHPHASIEFVVDSTVQLVELVDTARIDIAVMQVTDRDLRPDDIVLWSDQLHWVTSWEAPFDHGAVPLITFGDECFYRSLSEPLLAAAGIEFRIAFSAATTNGVRAAIEAGLGVGVLSSRHIGGEIVEWPRESSLPALPQVHQIARTVPGENRDAAAVLIDVLADELHEPSYHSERLAPTG